MNREERYQILKGKIAAAKRHYEDNFRDKENQCLQFYKGNQWSEGEWAGQDRVTSNVILPVVRTKSIAAFYQNPKIYTEPLEPMYAGGSRVSQAALNDYFERLKMKRTLQRQVQDSLISRFGVNKTAWVLQEKQRKLTEDERALAREEVFLGLSEAGEPIPDIDTIEELIPKSVPEVVKDFPEVRRLSPANVWIDPGCGDVEEMAQRDGWVVEQIVLPVSVVKADSRFKKSAVKDLKGDRTYNIDDYDKKIVNHPDLKLQTLYEIHYYEDGDLMRAFLAEGAEEILFEDEPDFFPYDFLRNVDVPEQAEGISEVEDLIQIQKEINRNRTLIHSHVKKWFRKYLIRKGLTNAQVLKDQLKQPVDGGFIEVDDMNDIKVLEYAPIPDDLFKQNDLLFRDLEFRTQLSRYTMGGVPDFKRLATEVQAADRGAGAILSDSLARVADHTASICQKLLLLLQKHLSGDQWAKISPEDAQAMEPFLQGELGQNADMGMFLSGNGGSEQHALRYNREALQGEYRVKVTVGSTMLKDDALNMKMNLDLYNTMRQDPAVNPKPLIEGVLTAFGRDNPAQYFAPPQPMLPPGMDPMAAQGLPPAMPPGGAPPHGGPMAQPGEGGPWPVSAHMQNRGFTPSDLMRGVRQ